MKKVLVLGASQDFIAQVVNIMRTGGHQAEGVVGLRKIQERIHEETPDLIIVGEEGPLYKRRSLIMTLQGPSIDYTGPILACDSSPESQNILGSTGATRTCASAEWANSARELLGLMAEE